LCIQFENTSEISVSWGVQIRQVFSLVLQKGIIILGDQGCFKGSSRGLQGVFNAASAGIQGGFKKGASRVLQGGFNEASRVLQGLQGGFKVASRGLYTEFRCSESNQRLWGTE